MGWLAFAPQARSRAVERVEGLALPAEPESLELLIAAIVAEADELKRADRARLAAKVLEFGGYETADGRPAENEKARLAIRLAARLGARN